MKISIKLLLGMCLFLFMVSCEEETARPPRAEININKLQLMINESMVVNFTGTADQAVVYTGDDMHDYNLRDQSNTGFVMNKDLFTYAYSVPGVYKVVCVASTYTDLATDLKQDTCSYIVTVVDDETEIERLSCPQVLYDEVFAKRMENDEWLMTLPRKVKYSTSTPSISLSQRLRFYIPSDSAKVSLNGKEYSAVAKYDLASPIDIEVKSNYGTVRPYKLYTLYYPEFNGFSLTGVKGVLSRSEFDYNMFEMNVTLPVGTDIRTLVPEFTMYSATDKVYIGDVEQISGVSMVDFSNGVTYRLVSFVPDNPVMQAVSFIKVSIK